MNSSLISKLVSMCLQNMKIFEEQEKHIFFKLTASPSRVVKIVDG